MSSGKERSLGAPNPKVHRVGWQEYRRGPRIPLVPPHQYAYKVGVPVLRATPQLKPLRTNADESVVSTRACEEFSLMVARRAKLPYAGLLILLALCLARPDSAHAQESGTTRPGIVQSTADGEPCDDG